MCESTPPGNTKGMCESARPGRSQTGQILTEIQTVLWDVFWGGSWSNQNLQISTRVRISCVNIIRCTSKYLIRCTLCHTSTARHDTDVCGRHMVSATAVEIKLLHITAVYTRHMCDIMHMCDMYHTKSKRSSYGRFFFILLFPTVSCVMETAERKDSSRARKYFRQDFIDL